MLDSLQRTLLQKRNVQLFAILNSQHSKNSVFLTPEMNGNYYKKTHCQMFDSIVNEDMDNKSSVVYLHPF